MNFLKTNNIQLSKEFVSKAEIVADEVTRKCKHILPTLARLCLISTFLEDGIRMWYQWSDQVNYMNLSWNSGYFLAFIFVLYNLIVQIVGCFMVLARVRVPIACGLLFSIVFAQTIAYRILWDLQFTLRNLALAGALLLLLAECKNQARCLFAGVPSLDDNRPKTYLQLTGRILIAFMFITLIRLEWNFFSIILDIFGSLLMVLVTIGFKTKLSALLLVVMLTSLNLYHNAWWSIENSAPLRDFLKYDFFQTLSVIGGLLMIVYLGPGGVSMDEHKKKW